MVKLARIVGGALAALVLGALLPAHAATLYVSEFANGLSQVGSTQPQVYPQPAITDQTVAVGGASTASAAFNAKTRAVMAVCDVGCSIVIGSSPTAATTNYLLIQGQPVEFSVVPGQKIAVIANTAGGSGIGGSNVTIVGPLGQAAMAASIPVVIANNQSAVPVSFSGAVSNASSGVAASSTNLGAASWLYGWNGATWDQVQVDGSKFLKTVVSAALPAGTNLLGKVGIDQTTPGTTNGVQVNAALPAGNNVIGHVIADSGSTTAVTGNVATTAADGAIVTLGAKADAKSTATDTTAVTMMQVLKEISFMAQTPAALPANQSANIAQFGGSNVATGTGASGAGVPRFTISNDSSLAAHQSTNVDQINGTAPTEKAASTAPALTDTSLVVAQSPNPAPVCTGVTVVNQTTGTDIKTFTNTGFICSIILVSATAQNIGVIEGTGTVCATGTTALIGGTTASVAVGVNGGFSAVAGVPWLKMQASADHLCITQSGAGNVSGVITWQDHS